MRCSKRRSDQAGDAKRKHLQSFVDRFRAKATKARQAQSRLKALEKMEPIADHRGPTCALRSLPRAPAPARPPIIAIEGACRSATRRKPVLKNLNLRIDADDRIALLGANGNGKSTFCQAAAGRLKPMAGEVQRAGRS
jgi:ATP-binding cassette, subfamily F, member 3